MIANKKSLTIGTAILLSIAFILYIVSNALPAWNKYTENGILYKAGLWYYRITDPKYISAWSFIKYPYDESAHPDEFCIKTRIAQGFLTTACVALGISGILLLFNVIDEDGKNLKLITVRILAILSLITGIVGVNIITETRLIRYIGWGPSPIIGIIAIIINSFGVFTLFFIKQQILFESFKLEE